MEQSMPVSQTLVTPLAYISAAWINHSSTAVNMCKLEYLAASLTLFPKVHGPTPQSVMFEQRGIKLPALKMECVLHGNRLWTYVWRTEKLMVKPANVPQKGVFATFPMKRLALLLECWVSNT